MRSFNPNQPSLPQAGNHSSPAEPHPPLPEAQLFAASFSRSDGSCWPSHFHQHAEPLVRESTACSQPLRQVSHTSRVGVQGPIPHGVHVCHWPQMKPLHQVAPRRACIARREACRTVTSTRNLEKLSGEKVTRSIIASLSGEESSGTTLSTSVSKWQRLSSAASIRFIAVCAL